MKVRKITLACLISGFAAAGASLIAHAQPVSISTGTVVPGSAIAVDRTKGSAVIVGIDEAARMVTLKRPDGKVLNVTISDEVRNFAQIRVGDSVNAEYIQAISLELRKSASDVRERTEQDSAVRAPPGALPGGAVSHEVRVLADVIAVDATQRIVTLLGPSGNVVDLAVEDPKQLTNIQAGDQVEVVYMEALAVSVEPAPKDAAK